MVAAKRHAQDLTGPAKPLRLTHSVVRPGTHTEPTGAGQEAAAGVGGAEFAAKATARSLTEPVYLPAPLLLKSRATQTKPARSRLDTARRALCG